MRIMTEERHKELEKAAVGVTCIGTVVAFLLAGILCIAVGISLATSLALSVCSLTDCSTGYQLQLAVGQIAFAFCGGTLLIVVSTWMWNSTCNLAKKNKNKKKGD